MSYDTMGCVLASIYNRFFTDGTNCGVLVREMRDKKSRIDTYGGPTVVVKASAGWQFGSSLATAQKYGGRPRGAVLGK